MNALWKYLVISVVFGLILIAPGACDSDDVALAPTSEAPVEPTATIAPTATPKPTVAPLPPLDRVIARAGTWRTADGQEVPEQIINSIMGPEHCSWETVTFLRFGMPLGAEKTSGSDTQTFTRDPYGDLNRGGWQLVQFDGDAELPDDAEFSGYFNDGVELWISPSRLETEVYMVDGSKVEKWPRMNPRVGCA
jgi:hypothetical protein